MIIAEFLSEKESLGFVIPLVEVVVRVKLELAFPLGTCLADLLSKLNNLLAFHHRVSLVVDVTIVHVGLIVCVDSAQGVLVFCLLRVVGEEFACEEGGDDADADGITVVHQELATRQVRVAETHIYLLYY